MREPVDGIKNLPYPEEAAERPSRRAHGVDQPTGDLITASFSGAVNRSSQPRIGFARWPDARRRQPIGADVGSEIDKHVAAQAQDRAVAPPRDFDLAIHLPRVVDRA